MLMELSREEIGAFLLAIRRAYVPLNATTPVVVKTLEVLGELARDGGYLYVMGSTVDVAVPPAPEPATVLRDDDIPF